jgi:lysophospholipase L1-like esterase
MTAYFRTSAGTCLLRVKRFNGEPVKKGSIVFLGNSITEFGDWKKLTGDTTVVNRGIAADNPFGVLDRLDEVVARQPNKIVVEIGINDISQGIPVEVIAENIFSIVAKIRAASPAAKVYVVSVLPTNDDVRQDYPELYGKNGVVFLLDDELRRNAPAKNFGYIDLKRQVSDENGDLDRRYARPDGLHLNEAGYRVWVRTMAALSALDRH